jgi:hypothetical protein
MNSSKVIVIKGASPLWPWKVDKKKPQEENNAPRKVQAVTVVARKKKEEPQAERKLKPITQLVRNSDGKVSEHKVKTLIHSLEKMIQ